MNCTYSLELPFRGERTYLHGTDLYQGLVDAISGELPIGPVSINFHSLLKNQPDLVCSSDSLRHLRSAPQFRGEVRFGQGDTIIHGVLLESDRPVKNHKVCNEDEVIDSAIVKEVDKTVLLENCDCGSTVERVVFLNKHLHLRILPDLCTKWLFARLELNAPFPLTPPEKIAVTLRQVLGKRFTCSDILFNGHRVGSISFSTHQ